MGLLSPAMRDMFNSIGDGFVANYEAGLVPPPDPYQLGGTNLTGGTTTTAPKLEAAPLTGRIPGSPVTNSELVNFLLGQQKVADQKYVYLHYGGDLRKRLATLIAAYARNRDPKARIQTYFLDFRRKDINAVMYDVKTVRPDLWQKAETIRLARLKAAEKAAAEKAAALAAAKAKAAAEAKAEAEARAAAQAAAEAAKIQAAEEAARLAQEQKRQTELAAQKAAEEAAHQATMLEKQAQLEALKASVIEPEVLAQEEEAFAGTPVAASLEAPDKKVVVLIAGLIVAALLYSILFPK